MENAENEKAFMPSDLFPVLTDALSAMMKKNIRVITYSDPEEKEGEKISTVSIVDPENNVLFFGVGKVGGNFQRIADAEQDLCYRIISKLLLHIPDGTCGYIISRAEGPGLRWANEAVQVIVHDSGTHSLTATIVKK